MARVPYEDEIIISCELDIRLCKQSKWIHFPWDIEYSFATPIKDGGRVAAGP